MAAVVLCTAVPGSAATAAEVAARPAAQPAAQPAAAPAAVRMSPLTHVVPILDCVVTSNGSFRAVFGYVNRGGGISIPIGSMNKLWPISLNGAQPTSFSSGTVHGAFATSPMPQRNYVTWRLGDGIVTAVGGANTCGPDVTLPTEGNGVGPLIVILASLGLSAAVGALRAWQLRRRHEEAA